MMQRLSFYRNYATMIAILSCHCACLSAEYTAEELAAGYSETVSSIETLYVEYEERFTDANGSTRAKSCVYARDGSKWHYATTPIPEEDGTTEAVEETVTCSDGKQAFLYYLSADPRTNGRIDFGTLEVRDARPEPMISPEYAIGVKVADLSRSLPSKGSLVRLLNAHPPLPIQQLGGPSGNELVIRPVAVAAGSVEVEYSIRARLDADHGFLPALLVVEFSEKSKREFPSHQNWSLEWGCQQFQQCLDHASGKQVWFPKHCQFIQRGGSESDPKKINQSTYSLALRAVEINKALEPNLFNPRVPSGTTIVDVTADGKGKISIQGGARAVDLRAKQLASKTANSGGGRYHTVILAFNLVALCAVVLYFYFARKGRSE